MKHLTDTILMSVVGTLPDTFDSHELIQAVMTSHPQAYVRELYEYVESADPIHETHKHIGLALKAITAITALDGIKAGDRVKSVNVRGRVTENQQWHKRATVGADGATTAPS